MKKIKLFLAFSLVTLIANAQVTLYKSYDDFKNNTGEEYDDYSHYNRIGLRVKLFFQKDGEEVKFLCKRIWGFKYKENLFRIDPFFEIPVRLMHAGKICYYENGLAHLKMLKDNTTAADFSYGSDCYLSKDISSDVIVLSSKPYEKFVSANPQFKSLFDCIGKNSYYVHVKECVSAYEEEE